MAMKEQRCLKRIKMEFAEVQESEEAERYGIKIELVDDKWTEFIVDMAGPPDSPYEGGYFKLDIKLAESYPFVPPKIRFVTKIWHPNIDSETGAIYLDILQDKWTSAIFIHTLLLYIQALLSVAEPDPLKNVAVVKQYIENPEMFGLTARYWTQVYAGGSYTNAEFSSKIQQLTAMELDEHEARVALSACDWDIERAVEQLKQS